MSAYLKTAHTQRLKECCMRTITALLCVLLPACQQNCAVLEPNICYSPPQPMVEKMPPAFAPLSQEEQCQDWAKELYLGKAFAKEMDLYRALTCFKRALILLPPDMCARRQEVEYDIFLAYYLGGKYQDALDTFERSKLLQVPESFPAFHDLLIVLYDAYLKNDQPDKAYKILCLIASTDEPLSHNLGLGTAVIEVNLPSLSKATEWHPAGPELQEFLFDYSRQAKSVSKARTLNTVLPGAGYYYVGQKKAAVTSFIINALFIAATYQLFDRGYTAAGIITGSLECGWYFGGINGAGLAAKEYNEQLYHSLGKEYMIKNRLFPLLMLQKGF